MVLMDLASVPDKECSECWNKYKKDGQRIFLSRLSRFDGDKVRISI